MRLTHSIQSSQGNASVYILSPEGDISTRTIQEFQFYVEPLLQDNNSKGIIINLRNVSYIDSIGIGELLWICQTLKANQKQMILCHLNTKHKMILEVTLLDSIFRYCPNEIEALKSFEAQMDS